MILNEKCLGIIGTAGRGDDYDKLSKELYVTMTRVAYDLYIRGSFTHLASGGAAWADHCVVSMTLGNVIPARNLKLFLPAPFENGRYVENGHKSPGSISNYYHRRFSQKLGRCSLTDIARVIDQGAVVEVGTHFFTRNSEIAKASDGLLAFTFGDGLRHTLENFDGSMKSAECGLKDGGTADTWNKSNCPKWHWNLQ